MKKPKKPEIDLRRAVIKVFGTGHAREVYRQHDERGSEEEPPQIFDTEEGAAILYFPPDELDDRAQFADVRLYVEPQRTLDETIACIQRIKKQLGVLENKGYDTKKDDTLEFGVEEYKAIQYSFCIDVHTQYDLENLCKDVKELLKVKK